MPETQILPIRRWTRDYVFDILKILEIHYIFGVPGTNEIPIIDGTSYPENGVKYIECLHENIAIGAAMGSARMTGKPGVVLVHVTPGIAHCIGNLFNAYRSNVPLVILCAQQQNELVTQEPLLASNLVDLARGYTKWAHEVRTPLEMAMVLQRAFKEAMAPPCGPVFISIPWEFTMVEINDSMPKGINGVTRISPHFTGDPLAITKAAKCLADAKKPLIVAGDAVGYANAWGYLQYLADITGAPVLQQTFSSVANFPNDDYHWQGELPGSQAGVQSVFAQHDVAFLVGFGAQAQITVFKYSDGSLIPGSVQLVYLTNNTWDIGKNYYGENALLGDIYATLPLLNEEVKRVQNTNQKLDAMERNLYLKGIQTRRIKQWEKYLAMAMTQKEIWSVVIADALRKEIEVRQLIDNFVYVHEAVSDSAPFQMLLPFIAGKNGARPISYYCVAGGSLGWSMPASLGIKLEEKTVQNIGTRLVINAVGDGSSLFYPQVWWTASHRHLPILYIITNNREYHTLQLGLQQVDISYGSAPGYNWKPKSNDPEYLRLQRPDLKYVELAKAFGVENGEVVDSPDKVYDAINRGIKHVLDNDTSYILDMRMDQNTPPPSPPDASIAAHYSERWTLQPVLDIFHAEAQVAAKSVKKLLKATPGAAGNNDEDSVGNSLFNMPSIS